MIFSHFKRRRGIRFDDGFRHSARERAAPDPDAPPVAGALANYDAYALDLDANDPVAEWGDSASAGPATQETLAAQPTYAPDVLDSGTPGVEFSGGQYLFLPDVLKITGDQEVSAFAVVYLPGSGVGAIYAWADDDSGTRGLYFLRESNNRMGLSYGGRSTFAEGDSFPGDVRTRIRVLGDTDTATATVNGTEVLTVNSGPATPGEAVPALMGARSSGGGSSTAGDMIGFIQQLIVYERRLSPAEVAQVQDWLDERWFL